jgi:hypothetical protein
MNKKIVTVLSLVVVLMISFALPCATHAAGVATEYQSYAPGDVVTIIGFGWQPGESVTLVLYDSTDLVNPYVHQPSSPALADGNGIFTSTYTVDALDDGKTFVLVATGPSSGSAQTVYDDAPHLHFFEDATQNITRDAFAWGSTVYARADDLGSRPCYQVKWIDPNNNIVATHSLNGSTNNDRNDSFMVPAMGPSGIWRAELYRPSSSSSDCSSVSFSLRYTLYFDVAQYVIIGADDSYISNHSPDLNTNSFILTAYTLDVNNDDEDLEKTFVRFPVPFLGVRVISATLRLRMVKPPSFSSSRTYNVMRVTDGWDVNTITFNNQPGVSAVISSSLPTPTGLSAINSLMRWNVTTDVDSFAHDLFINNGWRITDSEANDPEGIFFSTEFNTILGSNSKLYGPILLFDTDPKTAIPTMTEWGMIIFALFAGLGAVYFLKRQKKARN